MGARADAPFTERFASESFASSRPRGAPPAAETTRVCLRPDRRSTSRFARERNYRFNRRTRIADLADVVLQRAVAQPTITHRQLIDGPQPQGALPALTG